MAHPAFAQLPDLGQRDPQGVVRADRHGPRGGSSRLTSAWSGHGHEGISAAAFSSAVHRGPGGGDVLAQGPVNLRHDPERQRVLDRPATARGEQRAPGEQQSAGDPRRRSARDGLCLPHSGLQDRCVGPRRFHRQCRGDVGRLRDPRRPGRRPGPRGRPTRRWRRSAPTRPCRRAPVARSRRDAAPRRRGRPPPGTQRGPCRWRPAR